MFLNTMLSDIDECVNESYIGILDSMISYYDKAIMLNESDGSGIIQESVFMEHDEESIIKTIALAIPRLIAAFFRKIASLFGVDKHPKSTGGYAIDKIEKRYELAESIIENNPGIVLKLGAGIAGAAGGIKLWASKKAEAAKEKFERRVNTAEDIAKKRAAYNKYKSEADKDAKEMVAITIHPTKLKVFALSNIENRIDGAIEGYINGIKSAISRYTNNCNQYKNRKAFDKEINTLYESYVECPAALTEAFCCRGYSKEYESFDKFQEEINKVRDKYSKGVEKTIKDLSSSLREAYNYFDNVKLVKFSKEETRNTKHQQEADTVILKFVKAVVDNVTWALTKLSVYRDNAASMIEEINKVNGGEKDSYAKSGEGIKDGNIFNADNTKNIKTYFDKHPNFDTETYIKMLNAACDAIMKSGTYKISRYADSFATFKWNAGLQAPVKGYPMTVEVHEDGKLVITRSIIYGDDRNKLEDSLTITCTFVKPEFVRKMHDKADDPDGLNYVPSDGIFDNIEKAVKDNKRE